MANKLDQLRHSEGSAYPHDEVVAIARTKPRERDWIGCIQQLLAWGVVAAWLIYMLPIFAIVVLAHLVGLGPDGVGSRTHRH